ncbi:MAG: NUDIX domain-containing protein [Candidatus Diapherotrites archaeon]|nr:NUDIX domain-containing protein [Candidatus Diapherotrites archaeon]
MEYDFSRPIHYCASVFVIHENKILFLKQSRSNYLLLPGGHVEEDELPHETAVRETFEETSLKIELLEKSNEKARTKIVEPLPLPLCMRLLPCRNKKDIDFLYTAKIISGELKISEESTEAKWLSEQEIQNSQEVGPNLKYYALKILNEKREQ